MNNWGFKRHERLDVKKPGPPFDDKIAKSGTIKLSNNKKSLDGTFDADSFAHSLAHHNSEVDASYAYLDLRHG